MAKYKIIGNFRYSDLDVMTGLYSFNIVSSHENQTYLIVIEAYFDNLITLATRLENQFPTANITSVTKC